MLENLITSKMRLRLMVKFFINAANEGYLRGLATEMHENTNAIRKELNNLSEAGYLVRNESSKKVTYKANKEHPLFELLQKIVRKYVGLDTIVEQVIERAGLVAKVYLVGDYAQGIDSGRIEVVLEGEKLNEGYIQKLAKKLENEINKKVHISITDRFKGKGLLVFENLMKPATTFKPLKKPVAQKQWFVLYTKPNSEKKLAERLQAAGIACYCPTRTEVRQWSDRKKKVEVPVLPSIVLVYIENERRNRVFDFTQAVRYLFWMNKPAVVRDIEVESLRQSLNRKPLNIKTERIKVGDKISLAEAGFENVQGTVTHCKGNQCWVVLDSIGYIVKLKL